MKHLGKRLARVYYPSTYGGGRVVSGKNEAKLPEGFIPISGKRSPPKGETRYEVAFRRLNDSPFIDTTGYTASQLNWIHTGGSWDAIAIREIK